LHQEKSSPGFAVTILACGPLVGGMVYAVAVSQPLQSWTVLRNHDEFNAVGDALPDLCPCPSLSMSVVQARNELQEWLTTILMYPKARESLAVRNFLTVGANTILPQYEVVAWTQFNIAPHTPPPVESKSSPTLPSGPVDDMEMDDMFLADNEEGLDDHDDEDEDFIPAASLRYKLTSESITDEDELGIMGDVEMIEDIGSLAQSLGASHLGRSLNLQAELNKKQVQDKPMQGVTQGQGLVLGSGSIHQPSEGGLGFAMAQPQDSSMRFNHTPLESAPRLDSFKMIRVIGKGSFGKVFLVKEIKTGTIYALKVLRKDNIVKRNQVEHTKTERSVLGYVQHPFIVGMNMAFQSKDKLYFVLDYCAGGELFFHLGKEGRFPEPRARFYASEIVLALSYVHSLDIIYRDLKPENVLLDAQGHIRLTDFGLSKEGISNSSSGANSFCGTPEYLAPEILNRQGHGRAVDWWSLGALLYEMLTGLPPFYCQDRERLFEKIRKSELNYPPTVSKSAVSLLKGLLTKDPSRRLGSGPNDVEDIRIHEFFSAIEWEKLFRGEVPPPWLPTITGILDTSQFDKEFTNMPVFSPHSMQRAPGFGATPIDTHFEGFTFTDTMLHGPGAQKQSTH
jgi:serine/threonine protein kinase